MFLKSFFKKVGRKQKTGRHNFFTHLSLTGYFYDTSIAHCLRFVFPLFYRPDEITPNVKKSGENSFLFPRGVKNCRGRVFVPLFGFVRPKINN